MALHVLQALRPDSLASHLRINYQVLSSYILVRSGFGEPKGCSPVPLSKTDAHSLNGPGAKFCRCPSGGLRTRGLLRERHQDMSTHLGHQGLRKQWRLKGQFHPGRALLGKLRLESPQSSLGHRAKRGRLRRFVSSFIIQNKIPSVLHIHTSYKSGF